MKFRPNRAAKLTVAIAVVIAIGLGVNTLTLPSQVGISVPSNILYPPAPGAAPLRPDITTAAQFFDLSYQAGEASIATRVDILRMEIFSARLTVEVKDVTLALTQVASIAQQLGGYVAGSSASVFGDRETAAITIRVPRANFYPAVSAIESLGKLKDKATQSDDVTQEYIDLTARRDNLQRQEKRLQEILTLGTTVDDVLKVETELERVRGEIERLTGRINYFENYVALSTIMTTFTQPVETPLPELDWTEPFKTGIAFLYSTIRGLVIFTFAALPFAAIGTPAYLVYRHRRNRPTQGEATTPRTA